MKIIFFIFSVFALTQAYPSVLPNYGIQNTRIVGGQTAQPHQFPYQVGLNLFLQNGNVFFCGGSLITEWYVLTAAHCTDGVKKIEVVMGAHNVNNLEVTQIRMNTSIIITHEKWFPIALMNDIALVKLPKKVAFNKYIQPIRLPRSDSKDYTNENAIVTGWGKTSDNSNIMSDILRYVSTDILSNKQCENRYPKIIKDSHLCISARDGKSSCTGDSGGPLVVEENGEPLLIGIVSFGYPTCETNHPGVFTRVTKYLDWIVWNAEIK